MDGNDSNLYGYVLNNPINGDDPLGLRMANISQSPEIQRFERIRDRYRQIWLQISMAAFAIFAPSPPGFCEVAQESLLNNPVPSRMARVVPAEYANSSRLAVPNASEVWVTAADDLVNINTSQGLAQRLTLIDDSGNLISGPFAVIEFDSPTSGIASPVNRSMPGFVGGGRTAGGASEFVIPNLEINKLQNVTIRILK